MKKDETRVILGFYSSEQVDAEKAYQTTSALAGVKVRVFPGNGAQPSDGTQAHYSALRLEGESVLVAEVSPNKVEAVVGRLQSVGQPSIFVLRRDFANRASRLELTEPPDEWPVKSSAIRSILSRLRESELRLDTARRNLLEAARLGHTMTAAADWLLDNAYLIRTQMAEARRHLPRQLRNDACPAVYALAEQLVTTADQILSETNITESLRQYQIGTPLTISELWLFPLLLRIALFESLARLALRVSQAQQLREVAYLWANRLTASTRRGTDEFEKMLKRMETEPFALQTCFASSLAERL